MDFYMVREDVDSMVASDAANENAGLTFMPYCAHGSLLNACMGCRTSHLFTVIQKIAKKL